MASPRLRLGSLAFVAALAAATRAHAGDENSIGIAAASPDGKHAAIFNLTNGHPNGTGALITVNGKPSYDAQQKALAAATCAGGGPKVLPYRKWTWDKRPPELGRLVAFADAYDDHSAGKRARIVFDPDTRLARIEILKDERWWPAKAMPGSAPQLTGTLELPGRYLIRTHHRGNYAEWDEVSAITESEVPNTRARWQAARDEAVSATTKLRQLRAEGARPFTKRPSSVRDGSQWDYRRATMLDPAIEKWSIAAAYGPLGKDDLREMIWLLEARKAPGGTLVALRLVTALRERDQASADALLSDLEKDPDTLGLVPLLAGGRDPLRRLPDPSAKELTASDLTSLTNDELLWLHRMVRARGRFRFADRETSDYFSLFDWYQPVSQKTWQKLLVDKFFQKDPDKSALIGPHRSLAAIVAAEKERGIAKPDL